MLTENDIQSLSTRQLLTIYATYADIIHHSEDAKAQLEQQIAEFQQRILDIDERDKDIASFLSVATDRLMEEGFTHDSLRTAISSINDTLTVLIEHEDAGEPHKDLHEENYRHPEPEVQNHQQARAPAQAPSQVAVPQAPVLTTEPPRRRTMAEPQHVEDRHPLQSREPVHQATEQAPAAVMMSNGVRRRPPIMAAETMQFEPDRMPRHHEDIDDAADQHSIDPYQDAQPQGDSVFRTMEQSIRRTRPVVAEASQDYEDHPDEEEDPGFGGFTIDKNVSQSIGRRRS